MQAASVLRASLGERSYDITIGAGLLDRAGILLASLLPLRRVIVVTDENLARTAHPGRLVAERARLPGAADAPVVEGEDREPRVGEAAGHPLVDAAGHAGGAGDDHRALHPAGLEHRRRERAAVRRLEDQRDGTHREIGRAHV